MSKSSLIPGKQHSTVPSGSGDGIQPFLNDVQELRERQFWFGVFAFHPSGYALRMTRSQLNTIRRLGR